MDRLNFSAPECIANSLSPLLELGAYEALWDQDGASFKTLSEKFEKEPGALPSEFVSRAKAEECADYVVRRFKEKGVTHYGVRVHSAGEYPEKLRDADHPVELLYYRGYWDLVYSRCVAIVGTRNPSPDGLSRTRTLVRKLVADGFTIMSGLAQGIDTQAHETALDEGGRTIAVIGTPLSFAYPRANAALQERIGHDFLVISQVPLKRWEKQDHRWNRAFFPARNVTMSALTEATVIVEAGETSGTLIQARAALKQGRKLFILDSNFNRDEITWPKKFEDMGAIRVRTYSDVKRHLSEASH
jgi:DNA processing protein